MRLPPCFECRHYRGESGGERRCDAFPGGIPAPILASEADHSKPYPGDRGIRFERDPGRASRPSPDPDLSGFEFPGPPR